MKNLRQNLDDSLRPEYKRSDFGEMVQGKFANTHLEFAELVRILIACIGEDESLTFHDYPAAHKSGDWSYEIDHANQITLRHWINEFSNIAEPISNTPSISTPQERSDLHELILSHVRILKNKVTRE